MTETKTYVAHIDSEGNEQSVKEHLTGTARRTGEFAAEFGCREMGYHCGLMHDIGKYSDAFQKRIHNPEKYGKIDHSTAGAKETKPMEGMIIAGHHSGLMDGGNRMTSFAGDGTYFGRMKSVIPDYDGWKEDLSEVLKQNFGIKQPDYVRNGGFSAAFFMRMLYSCLVDADYLDTESFMNKGKAENRSGYDTLETLIKKFNDYIESWINPIEPVKPLYRCRTKILRECMEEGEKLPKGLYTLTVPTGGGKTTASMGFALRHAKSHNKKRIIYVIPYTSIIDQTADAFSSIFGKSNVVEHHSGVLLDLDENNCNPWQIRNVLATENWDAPIIVTTAVQFFESLFANKSSKCRKLHNLCNSVIIFDEAQTLPIPYLKPCIAAIAQLVQNYGATAVLCTATQPALGAYFKEYVPDLELQEIYRNCSKKEENSVFERVTIRNLGVLTKAQLKERLTTHNQVLCVVNLIFQKFSD